MPRLPHLLALSVLLAAPLCAQSPSLVLDESAVYVEWMSPEPESLWQVEVSKDLESWQLHAPGADVAEVQGEPVETAGETGYRHSLEIAPEHMGERLFVRLVEPTEKVLRWSAWEQSSLTGSYVSLVDDPEGGFSFWRTYYWSTEGLDILTRRDFNTFDDVIGQPIPEVNPAVIVMDTSIISDVEPAEGRNGPILSRASVNYFPGTGYVAVAATAPEYQGGSLDLLARLFVSPDGSPDSWTNLGSPAGEPRGWIDAQKALNRKVRTDGGAIFQLEDGSWRLYLNGFGRALAAMEAEALEGPWSFVRNESGNIREMLSDLPSELSRGGWIFPTVTRLPDGTFIAFVSDQWYPTAIWAAVSTDGINFTHLGDGPTILRADIPAAVDGMKNLRVRADPATGNLTGLLALWDSNIGTWRTYIATGTYGP